MSKKYKLYLQVYKIFQEVLHAASHLYWAIKDTETDSYPDGYTFHGGVLGDRGDFIEGFGLPHQPVGISHSFGLHELNSDSGKDVKIAVLEFDTLEEIKNVKAIFKAVGNEINALGEKYGLFFDNSNSVAYLLGRSLGLSDTQLQGFYDKLEETGWFGAPGFGDDLLNGADGKYAGMSVETFVQKARESSGVTNEEIQKIFEKVGQLRIFIQDSQTEVHKNITQSDQTRTEVVPEMHPVNPEISSREVYPVNPEENES